MAWKIEFKPSARKVFDKLDRSIQKKILKFLNTKIAPIKDPLVFGKPLQYEQYGLWRYRVEDYRIICQIDKGAIKILIVKIGHRRDIYDE